MTRRKLHPLRFGIALVLSALLGVGCASSEEDILLPKELFSTYQRPLENQVRVDLGLVEDIQGVPEYEKDPGLWRRGPGGERVNSDLSRTELVSRVTLNKLRRLGLPAVYRPEMSSDNPAERGTHHLGAIVKIRSFKITPSTALFEAQITLECAFFEPGNTLPFWSGSGEGRGRVKAAFLRTSAMEDAIEEAVKRCVEQSHAQDIKAPVEITAQVEVTATASNVLFQKGRATETSGNVQGALDLYAQAYRMANDAHDTTEAVKALVLLLRKKSIQPPFPEEARKFGVQANSLAKSQQYNKAIQLYEKALDVGPWWAEGHFNRALLLADQNQFPSAITSMQLYLILAPTAPDARAGQDKIYEWELK